MEIQFSDVVNLFQILIWPAILLFFLLFYRNAIKKAIKGIIPRIGKLSIANLFTVELREISGLSLEDEGPVKDIASREIYSSHLETLLSLIENQATSDCAVINLGKGKEWLTSRLFLLSFLMKNLVDLKCFVFLCEENNMKKKYVGNASPEQVQDAIAKSFPMYITIMEKILRELNTSIYNTRLEVRNLSEDPERLSKAAIDFVEKLQYKNQKEGKGLALVNLGIKYEHANWINGPTIRKMLGGELNESYIIKKIDDTQEEFVKKILKEHGKFVAVVDSNHVYQSLVDRFAVLEKITQKLG